MITLDELKTNYSDSLIIQYRTKNRARATIQALATELWLDGLALKESVCFDLDTAVGNQLDIIGRIVGCRRDIFGLDLEHEFLEMTAYSGTPAGVDEQRYDDAVDGPEIMLRYNSSATYTMSDFEFRYLIKLKILFNTTNRTAMALTDAFFVLFGSLVQIVDNLDMTMTLNVQEPYHNVFIAADYIDIIPKPMGVAYTLNLT